MTTRVAADTVDLAPLPDKVVPLRTARRDRLAGKRLGADADALQLPEPRLGLARPDLALDVLA
jgi:hypothetical protein